MHYVGGQGCHDAQRQQPHSQRGTRGSGLHRAGVLAEGERQAAINRAQGEASAIEAVAGATAHALERLDAAPQDVYFFDDLLPNVNAARRMGIRAFRVGSFAAIGPILRREGL